MTRAMGQVLRGASAQPPPHAAEDSPHPEDLLSILRSPWCPQAASSCKRTLEGPRLGHWSSSTLRSWWGSTSPSTPPVVQEPPFLELPSGSHAEDFTRRDLVVQKTSPSLGGHGDGGTRSPNPPPDFRMLRFRILAPEDSRTCRMPEGASLVFGM